MRPRLGCDVSPLRVYVKAQVRDTVDKFNNLALNVVSKPMPRCRLPYLGFVVLTVFLPLQLAASPDARDNSAIFQTLASDAQSAREAGKTEDAIRHYQAAVKLRPDWEEGWWYLGTLLYDADHFVEAIPALRRVVDL